MPSQRPFSERRRAHRIDTALVFSIEVAAGKRLEARSVNLSSTGVLCTVDHDVPIMSRLEISVFLPKEIRAQGVLVRKEQDLLTDKYRLAIYFAEISEAHQKRLNEYIQSHKGGIQLSGAVGLVLAVCFTVLSGCAEISPPSAQEILENPLGKGPLRIGMTKAEVRELWGEPNQLQKSPTDSIGSSHEEWVYEAKYPDALPANIGYVSQNKYLVFDGENLVRFHD